MNLEEVFRNMVQYDMSDQSKKTHIIKALQQLSKKNITYEEALPVFKICLPVALENSSNKATLLSLFAFATWGNKFPEFLMQYLTLNTITKALSESDPTRLKIVLMWLKEGLRVLNSESEYISSISPILSGVLENKFLKNGRQSGILSQISEICILCPSLLPLQHMRLKFTISIMHCVASFPTPTKPETLKHMKNLGDLITMLWETLQLEAILSTLIAMYNIISNTDTSIEVCPAMAHILSLVFPQVVESLSPRIVSDPHTSNDSFEATLIRLCSWLITWPTAQETLVHWIRTLMRLLYQSGRNLIPARITYDQTPKLLEGLRIPICRPGVLSVATILLMSFQYSAVAFHRVIVIIKNMIEWLENEPSESAKETLNGLVKLCHAQMAMYTGHPDTYQSLMDVMMKYSTPSDEEIQSLIQEHNWVIPVREGAHLMNDSKSLSKLLGASSPGTPVLAYHKRAPGQKVGLRNLGNTCYMNSVIQALFMTDDFRHSILHAQPKSNQQLLVKLQHLFTSLYFSHRSHISPRTFHDTSRPPWFSPGMQHDCSEYLRHLMITLHEEERSGQKLPEYQERMIIESETTSLASDLQQLPEDNYQCQMSDNSAMEYQDNAKLTNKMDEEKKVDISNEDQKDEKINKTKPPLSSDSNFKRERESDSEGVLKKSSAVDETMDSCDQEVRVMKDDSVKDVTRESGSCCESMKRKHNVSPVASSQLPRSKSPKGESSNVTSETDNSSDSGISGDLAEELDFQNLRKGDHGSGGDKTLYIQEVNAAIDNDYFVSQVHKIFGGKISTSIKCLNCKTESIHKDVFTDINLAFQDSDQCNASTTIRKQPERLCKQKQGENVPDLKIEDMIANFLTSERLTGENQYECDRCGGKQDAERSIQILETPEHLILTQLRFYYDTSKGQRQKVFTNVDFGEELLFPNNGKRDETVAEGVMSPTDTIKSIASLSEESPSSSESCLMYRGETIEVSESSPTNTYDRYALYGVVVHSGFSSEGGHYYCYARNSSLAGLPQATKESFENMGDWFNLNDERVTKTTFCTISRLTKTFTRDTAYLLFYRKVDLPNGLPHSKVPLLEDFSCLRKELQDLLEAENLQYRSEQEAEALKKRMSRSANNPSIFQKKDNDEDPPPPSGGTCGDGAGFSITSREVF